MALTGAATYNGVSYNLPGTYTQVNPAGLTYPSNPAAPIVFLIGNSVGGAPGKVLGPFTAYYQAVQALQGGDTLDACRLAMKAGAAAVAVWRPYSATQSGLTLKDASANPSVVLTSSDYGNWTNALLASISGSPGSITATLQDNYHNNTLTSPTLGGVVQLSYTGNGTSAVVFVDHALTAPTLNAPTTATTGGSIAASTPVFIKVVPRNSSGQGAVSNEENIAVGAGTSTNTVTVTWTAEGAASSYDVYVGTATGAELYYGNVVGAASGTISETITSIPSGTAAVPSAATDGPNLVTWVSGQSDGSKNLDVNLAGAAVSTCQGLAAFLNGQIGYSAILQTNAGAISAAQIDVVSDQSLAGANGYTLTSAIGAVVAWFNTTNLVTAKAATNATAAPAAISLTPFAGGSDGTSQLSDWQDAANAVLTTSPQLRYIVPLTSTLANMQAVNQAMQTAAQPPYLILSEGFYGGAVGETVATAQQNAATLNTRRAMYAGVADFYDYNSQYVLTHFAGYTMAAYYAGLRAGLGPQVPLTAKQINVVQLGQTLTAAQVAALNAAGVAAPLTEIDGTIEISLGTTTELKSQFYNNLYYVEESVGNSIDTLSTWLMGNMNAMFKGAPNYGATTQSSILAELNTLLQTARDVFHWIAGFQPPTQIVALQTNPTYSVVPLTVNVVEPINGIILALNLQLPVSTALLAG